MSGIKIAFAGFRHPHIFDLYKRVKKDPVFTVTAAYENSEPGLINMRKSNIPATHTDFDTFLQECNADIIAVGDYFAARGDETIKALKARKHVISDKPLCTSLSQLNEIERLCEDNSLSAFLMLDLRYRAPFIAAREIIRSGKLGEIKNIQFNGAHDLDYKNRPRWYFEEGKQGGTINDLAVHGTDLVRYLTGLEFKEVIAAVQTNAYADKEPGFRDSASFIYTLENNALVSADTSYCSPVQNGFTLPQYWRFNVWGTKGAAEFGEASDEVRIHYSGAPQIITVRGNNAQTDALSDLISEVNGKKGILGTNDSLIASRIALTLQQSANSRIQPQL